MTAGFSPVQRRWFWGLLAAGTVGRLIVGFTSVGVDYDIDSYRLMDQALRDAPLDAYDVMRWPYPPGFLPWTLIAGELSRETGIAFHGLIKLPAIAADAALAMVVAASLGARGARAGTRLGAVALIALGPSFWLISARHGHFDALAILPAVLAVDVWAAGGAGRARRSGLLTGVGGALKTVPLFTVFALLPTARSRREAATVILTALAVPLALLVPFLVANFDGTVEALHTNRGVPGFGGPSLAAQPDLIEIWIRGADVAVGSTVRTLTDLQNAIVGIAVLAVGGLLWWRRTEPYTAAAAVWVTVVAVNPNFAFQYVVWVLPFLLLAGWVPMVAVLEALLLVPGLILYRVIDVGDADLGLVYAPIAIAAWLAFVVCWIWLLARVWNSSPSPAPALSGGR